MTEVPDNGDSEMLGRPETLIAYTVFRQKQLSSACKMFEYLKVPLNRSDDDTAGNVTAQDIVDHAAMVSAVHLHPKIIRWSKAYLDRAHSEVQFIRGFAGFETMAHVESIIIRDRHICDQATRIFDEMAPALQAAVETTSARTLPTVTGLDVPRTLLSLPGAFLFAWEAEWHQAATFLNENFGDIEVPEAPAIDALHHRLRDIEADVDVIRRQMLAASAILRPLDRDPAGAEKT